jgi:predicted nucleotidyltransferase
MKSVKSYGFKKLEKINVSEALEMNAEELINALKKEFGKAKNINALILFGSFARGDYSLRHSDLDLMFFLDKDIKDEKLEEEIRKKVIQLNLDKKVNVHLLFQYKKIEEEDKSLMLTIAREGQVIFANKLGLKEYYLIKFETAKIKPVHKNQLQRFLYGYKINGKKYLGIVDNDKVFSAGKGAILVAQELLQKILIFAQRIEVKAIQKGKFYR